MKLSLAAVAATALLVATFAVAFRDGLSLTTPSEDSDDRSLIGSTPPARFPLPAFSLRDYTGETIASAELRGKVTILTFLDTECEEACPIIAGEISSTAALLTTKERSQVAFVAITSDPTTDTPSAIRTFLQRHRAIGTLHYLSGPVSTLQKLWRSFQILSSLESGNADVHSAPVRIYSRDGIWLTTQHAGADLTPTNLAHDIRIALAGQQE